MDDKANDQEWDGRTRNVAWSVVSSMRTGLGLSISPVIASSFILVHRYFRSSKRVKAPLYVILVAAVFLSCKIEDSFRSLSTIYKSFISSMNYYKCKTRGQMKLELLGNVELNSDIMKPEDIELIPRIEIAFLCAIDFNMEVDLPIPYINSNVVEIERDHCERAVLEALCDRILRNMCLILRNTRVLDLDTEIVAAASAYHAYEALKINKKVMDWIDQCRLRCADQFKTVEVIITTELASCHPIRQRK